MMVSLMQNPYFGSYPFAGTYPYYNATYNGGFPEGGFYGYRPWGHQIGDEMTTTAGRVNSSTPNFTQHGGPLGYPQYFNTIYNNKRHNYPYSTWYGYQQPLIPQMPQWQFYYPYWTNFNINYGNGTYHSWPMMNYYRNQIQFPVYTWPIPVYWGVQRTFTNDMEQGFSTSQEQFATPLENTSNRVLNDFHVPSAVAKKTLSDIPRTPEYRITLKESHNSISDDDDSELPFLFRVSENSIQQIAPSRSFGPSMIYMTDSDPNNNRQ